MSTNAMQLIGKQRIIPGESFYFGFLATIVQAKPEDGIQLHQEDKLVEAAFTLPGDNTLHAMPIAFESGIYGPNSGFWSLLRETVKVNQEEIGTLNTVSHLAVDQYLHSQDPFSEASIGALMVHSTATYLKSLNALPPKNTAEKFLRIHQHSVSKQSIEELNTIISRVANLEPKQIIFLSLLGLPSTFLESAIETIYQFGIDLTVENSRRLCIEAKIYG